MDRNGDRRMGTERRRREELFFPWQDVDWAGTWDGTERRVAERRAAADRRHPVAARADLAYYSDDWARARGARNFNEWLDRSASQAPIGLPRGWMPAA